MKSVTISFSERRKKSIPPFTSESSKDVREHIDETSSPVNRCRYPCGSWAVLEIAEPMGKFSHSPRHPQTSLWSSSSSQRGVRDSLFLPGCERLARQSAMACVRHDEYQASTYLEKSPRISFYMAIRLSRLNKSTASLYLPELFPQSRFSRRYRWHQGEVLFGLGKVSPSRIRSSLQAFN
ncbi:hypothetical protein CEXT_237751 [Caerostris extrusa]|uniref:Uncharacterized protein n=1 Tax=Caerostris extrusa TaxID=172846 RepID=A0AAV4UX91_CAEEX|nr:hypothetical protein CEXT_237751 [Caerostris extrusa]